MPPFQTGFFRLQSYALKFPQCLFMAVQCFFSLQFTSLHSASLQCCLCGCLIFILVIITSHSSRPRGPDAIEITRSTVPLCVTWMYQGAHIQNAPKHPVDRTSSLSFQKKLCQAFKKKTACFPRLAQIELQQLWELNGYTKWGPTSSFFFFNVLRVCGKNLQ